jgi:hypothetical protein
MAGGSAGLKGHCTGPLTFGITVKDRDGRDIVYQEGSVGQDAEENIDAVTRGRETR